MCEVKVSMPQEEIKKTFHYNLLLRTIFHLAYFLCNNFVSIFGLITVFGITEEQEKDDNVYVSKRFVYCLFTNWNYTFQLVFLTLAVLYDSLEWANKNDSEFGKKIKYWRDIIFCGMVVPYTLFVTSMFWCVYWIDRELVFPKVFDDIVPWWFNHCVHTNITVVLIIETLLQPRRHPTNKKLELTLNGTIAVGYAVVYYSIYFFTGHWLYKVFGVMTWWQVVLYQILIWTSNYVFYIMQFPINRLVHGPGDTDQQNEVTTEVKDLIDGNMTKENGEQEKPVNGFETNGVQDKNGKQNGVEITSMTTDLQIPPFSTKSWSLKYRTLRSQFENTKL